MLIQLSSRRKYKTLSVQDCIRLLHNPYIRNDASAVSKCLQALACIRQQGSAKNASSLLRVVLSHQPAITKKAAQVVHALITQNHTHTDWVSISLSSQTTQDLVAVGINSINNFSIFPPEQAAHLYGIASFCPNGFVREKALLSLRNLPVDHTLPYLLLRLNDWVVNVRNAAKQLLLELIPKLDPYTIIKHHRCITWLGITKRVNLASVQRMLITHMLRPKNLHTLTQRIAHLTPQERLFLLTCVPIDLLLQQPKWLNNAIVDASPTIRHWAASMMRSASLQTPYRLQTLMNDNAIRVRHQAIRNLSHSHFLKQQSIIQPRLFDKSKAIRTYAQYLFSTYTNTSLATIYRNEIHCKVGSIHAGMLAGLAETGDLSDIHFLKSYLQHPKACMRAAALTGLHHLQATDMHNHYLRGLSDASAKVRNACVSIWQSSFIDQEEALMPLLQHGSPATQIAAFKVLTHQRDSQTLPSILCALGIANQALQTRAWQQLIAWCNYYAAKGWLTLQPTTYHRIIKHLNALQNNPPTPTSHAAARAWEQVPWQVQAMKPRTLI